MTKHGMIIRRPEIVVTTTVDPIPFWVIVRHELKHLFSFGDVVRFVIATLWFYDVIYCMHHYKDILP